MKSYSLFSEQPLNSQHHFRQESTFFLCLVSSCCYHVSQIQRRVDVLLPPVKQPQKVCKMTVLSEFVISSPLPHFSNYLANISPEVKKLIASCMAITQVAMRYIATDSKAFSCLPHVMHKVITKQLSMLHKDEKHFLPPSPAAEGCIRQSHSVDFKQRQEMAVS